MSQYHWAHIQQAADIYKAFAVETGDGEDIHLVPAAWVQTSDLACF